MAKSRLTEPQATVIIWNYNDRLDTNNTDGADPQAQDQVLVLTASLANIQTSKSKSQPAGQFAFTLAPTFNWVSRITPGSWCTILMTRNEPIPDLNDQQLPGAHINRDKMFGKIKSVRQSVTVDSSGARKTQYVVSGTDWGDVFNQPIYVDPTVARNVLEKYNSLGQAVAISYSNQLSNWANLDGLPSSHDAVRGIIRLWGAPIKDATEAIEAQTGLLGSADKVFQIPKPVVKYFNFTTSTLRNQTIDFADVLHDNTQTGILEGPNKYSGDIKEAFGFYAPDTIMGQNSLWQLINDNANLTLNEVIADFSWEAANKPNLSLTRRIRPFINRDVFPNSSDVSYLISPFKYVKKNYIPLEDVISINAGTNVDDRINFVEIVPSVAELKILETQTKIDAQVFDDKSISRDGFKPKFESPKYVPFKDGQISLKLITDWKYIIKEWHFNNHLLLNGTVTLSGQDAYIGVGENIMIPARVLGEENMNTEHAKKGNDDTYLLAHVESVSHSFQTGGNGARSYTTTIQFVRGIITDIEGNTVNSRDDRNIAIDSDARQQNAVNRERNRNTVASSTDRDPDTRRFTEDK